MAVALAALGLAKGFFAGGRDLLNWFRFDELGKRLGIAFLAVIAVVGTLAWSYGKGAADANVRAELKAASAKARQVQADLDAERAQLAAARRIEAEQRTLAEQSDLKAAAAEEKLKEALRDAAESASRNRVCIPGDLRERLHARDPRKAGP